MEWKAILCIRIFTKDTLEQVEVNAEANFEANRLTTGVYTA